MSRYATRIDLWTSGLDSGVLLVLLLACMKEEKARTLGVAVGWRFCRRCINILWTSFVLQEREGCTENRILGVLMTLADLLGERAKIGAKGTSLD